VIATRLGLAIATVIACVLAIVLAIDLRRDTAPPDRAVVPGFAAEQVTELEWRDRVALLAPGAGDLRIVRDPGGATGWRWVEPAGAADQRTVEDVLAALRGARWHRRTGASAAGRISEVLTIKTAGAAHRISIGEPLSGGEQQWIVIGDHALLVDTWVVRALVPTLVALRVRTPLAGAAQATELQIDPGIKLRGVPRRFVSKQGELLVSPRLVDDLERALAEVVVTEVPRGPVHRHGMQILFDGKVVVAEAGRCAQTTGTRAIDGPASGPGCIDERAWQAVRTAADAFLAPLDQIIEHRPAPVEPMQITLIDKAVLDLAKRPRVGDHDADPARIAELLAVLATPAEVVPLPKTKHLGELAITDSSKHSTTIELYAGNIIARRGEPLALRVGEGSFAILARPARALRDPTLWTEEPTTIRSIKIDRTTYTRGAVIGEWTGPSDLDAAALEQLVALLAAPRAQGDLATPPAARHTIELEIAPPAGAPTKRSLTLVRGPGGCAATIDGAHVLVDPQICTLADRL